MSDTNRSERERNFSADPESPSKQAAFISELLRNKVLTPEQLSILSKLGEPLAANFQKTETSSFESNRDIFEMVQEIMKVVDFETIKKAFLTIFQKAFSEHPEMLSDYENSKTDVLEAWVLEPNNEIVLEQCWGEAQRESSYDYGYLFTQERQQEFLRSSNFSGVDMMEAAYAAFLFSMSEKMAPYTIAQSIALLISHYHRDLEMPLEEAKKQVKRTLGEALAHFLYHPERTQNLEDKLLETQQERRDRIAEIFEDV